MKTISLFAIVIALALLPFAAAQSGHVDFSAIQPLLDNPIPCGQLSEQQLEQLGEYFMELRHPGGVHEAMDQMMGGEGSESLRQAHIRMGEAFYCASATGMMGPAMEIGMAGHGVAWLVLPISIVIFIIILFFVVHGRKQ